MRSPLVLSATVLVVLGLSAIVCEAQKPKSAPRYSSSNGINWAIQAMAALTGGLPVNSVTESGSVMT